MTAKVDRVSKPEPAKDMLPNEIKMCELLADPDNRQMTKTKLAQEVGVSRQTLYLYLTKKRVLEYLTALTEYYADVELPNVWRALIRKAKKEDMSAIKLYFELKGKYLPPAMRAEIDMKNATINVISNIPRPDKASPEGEVDHEEDQ